MAVAEHVMSRLDIIRFSVHGDPYERQILLQVDSCQHRSIELERTGTIDYRYVCDGCGATAEVGDGDADLPPDILGPLVRNRMR